MTDSNSRVAQAPAIAARAGELFRARYNETVQRTDRLFGALLAGQWLFGIAVSLLYSPYTWQGRTRSVHLHVYLAIFLGAAIIAFPLFLIRARPGAPVTRHVIAIAQMLWSALLIHLTGGRIETHFHVFGSLAFLAFYRDWRVLVPATVVVAGDHLVRQLVFPESVYGISNPEWWRFLEHAFWVVFEDVFLVLACLGGVSEMKKWAEQQARIELTEQVEHELAIAARIQTAVLPPPMEVRGLEIAAKMVPAAEVGGDYYDFFAVPDGCWIGIGDVAGHGLVAGLVMLQAQSALRGALTSAPDRAPRDVLSDVNRVLYENVKTRLAADEHMTMSVARYYDDGRLCIAGAHQDVLIHRAHSKSVERLTVRGTWLALVDDIRAVTEERMVNLEPGDVVVLFTDGITEAISAAEEQFGIDRLCKAIERHHEAEVSAIRDELLSAVSSWSETRQDDDVTILVMRYVGRAQAQAA